VARLQNGARSPGSLFPNDGAILRPCHSRGDLSPPTVHRISVITNYIYVDESKQRDYLLVASIHVDSDLAELRAVVRDLLLPGQRYLHMKNEKVGRKRTIAQAFVTAGTPRQGPRTSPRRLTVGIGGARCA
jgi:hypothetical protein